MPREPVNKEKWRTCKVGSMKIKGYAQALRMTREKQFKSQKGRKLPLDMTMGRVLGLSDI